MRVGYVLLGGALLLSTFSPEDTERRLQSYFQSLWIKLDDSSRAAVSRTERFLTALSGVVLRVLDRLFGPRALSLQTVAVSVLLALSAYDLNYGLSTRPFPALLWQAFGFLLLAGLPLVHPRLAVVSIGAFGALVASVLYAFSRGALNAPQVGSRLYLPWVLLWFGAVPLSFASDLAVLWVERRLLRWLRDAPSVVRASVTVLASAAAIGAVVVGPVLLSSVFLPDRPRHGLTMQMAQPALPTALDDLAAMNVFTVLPLLLLLIGTAAFMLHRAMWWVVTQLSYGAQKDEFLTGAGYRKWARIVGWASLLYGLRIVPDALVGTLTGH